MMCPLDVVALKRIDRFRCGVVGLKVHAMDMDLSNNLYKPVHPFMMLRDILICYHHDAGVFKLLPSNLSLIIFFTSV